MQAVHDNDARLASLEARVARLFTLVGEELTVESPPQPRPPRMASIIAACAQVWDVPIETIYSVRRHRRYALPRQAAMYLSRELCQHSFPAIGTAFRRDHSTVQHGVRSAAARLHADPEFAGLVQAATALSHALMMEATRA